MTPEYTARRGLQITLAADVMEAREPAEFADAVRRDAEEALGLAQGTLRVCRIGAPGMPLLRGPVPGETLVDLALTPGSGGDAESAKLADLYAHVLTMQLEDGSSRLRGGRETRRALTVAACEAREHLPNGTRHAVRVPCARCA